MGQGPAKVHVALLPGIAFACCRVKPLNLDAGFLATSTNQAISQATEVQRIPRL